MKLYAVILFSIFAIIGAGRDLYKWCISRLAYKVKERVTSKEYLFENHQFISLTYAEEDALIFAMEVMGPESRYAGSCICNPNEEWFFTFLRLSAYGYIHMYLEAGTHPCMPKEVCIWKITDLGREAVRLSLTETILAVDLIESLTEEDICRTNSE